MKYRLLAFAVLSASIFTSAEVLASGEGHVVHCSYEGTNSPNRPWSTRTADDADTIVAVNACLRDGGNVNVDRPYNNAING